MNNKGIELARDIIAQIRAKKLNVVTHTYMTGLEDVLHHEQLWDAEVKPKVDKVQAQCKVCALGSLILAKVRAYNHMTGRQLNNLKDGNPRNVYHYLSDIFDQKTLGLIEYTFEGADYGWMGIEDLPSAVIQACYNFHCQYEDPEDRLLAIMSNVVANNGVFDPTK